MVHNESTGNYSYSGGIVIDNDFYCITVVYGHNIDQNKLFPATDTDTIQGVKVRNATEIDSSQNTYMVMCMKKDDRVAVKYISVSHGDGVDPECIDLFIDTQLKSDNMSEQLNRFISKQITDSSSVYNYSGADTERSSSNSGVVLSVTDMNYYIDNYVTTYGNTYPLLIYRKNIDYQAILVANDLEDEDLYVIAAFVHITPGTEIDSFTEEELESVEGARLYNRTYGNAIAIKGVRTIFENLFPDSDHYIYMSPNSSLNNANNSTISVSLGIPPSVSTSFDVPASSSTINMTTSYERFGQCTVEFEAFRSSLLYPMNPCISTEAFSYVCGVYMSSGGNVLYTSVATDILYYFQPSGQDSAIWVGSARRLYYVNN